MKYLALSSAMVLWSAKHQAELSTPSMEGWGWELVLPTEGHFLQVTSCLA